jgi:hypothetical protein
MENTLIIRSVSVFIAIWGIATVFLWFRPKIEFFWKLVATMIFLFYLWFFHDEIARNMASFRADWYIATIAFFKELLVLSFVFLFFLWPVVLFVVFYKSDDMGAESLLKLLCVITIVLWIIFAAYVFYDKKIDAFLYEKLKTLIPFTHK